MDPLQGPGMPWSEETRGQNALETEELNCGDSELERGPLGASSPYSVPHRPVHSIDGKAEAWGG